MLIELKIVSKKYVLEETEVLAVRNVSLMVKEGDFLAIMGASGSGKSTLLNILGAFDKPDTGKYVLSGTNISSLSADELSGLRCSFIGFVFQNFNLIPRLNVLENVELPMVYAGVPSIIREQTAMNCLGAVGLLDKAKHKPMQLSGGERQRVAIARALVNSPKIIIADEPTGNLDSKTGKDIMNILKTLNEQGITIILVTHDAETAAYADRIVKMKDGVLEKPDSNTHYFPEQSIKLGKNLMVSKKQIIPVKESIKLAFSSLLANKIRSLLMLIGMFIAVASVIISVSIGEAGKNKINKEIQSFGSNVVWIYRDWSDRNKKGETNFTANTNEINNDDLILLNTLVKQAKIITPKVYFEDELNNINNKEKVMIIGTTSSEFYTGNESLMVGRFIVKNDIDEHHQVCVLSAKASEKIYGKQNPIGKHLYLNNERFTVIGVLAKKDTSFLEMIGSVQKGRIDIFVPINIVQRWLNTNNIHSIEASAFQLKQSVPLTKQIVDILNKQHKNRTIFKSETLEQYIKTSNKVMGILSVVLGFIAGISLLVGGLGIMNIMFVSVAERTKEIGIRKAIGATSREIILQFIIESITIGFLGGLAGMLFGLAIVLVLQFILKIPGLISIYSILIAFTSSLIVGLAAGIYPSKKAAELDPAITLRYE